jgi:WD40 repeat protein
MITTTTTQRAMALYFEYGTDLGTAGGDSAAGDVVAQAWSSSATDRSMLAVSTEKNGIALFLDEGERLDDQHSAVIKRPGAATVLAWHPTWAVLASGWNDGTVCLWTEKERALQQDHATHKAALTHASWSPDGSLLVTGDGDGTVGVWQADQRGRLLLICAYTRSGS